VRQIGDGLYKALEFLPPQFVDHQGEKDGRRKSENDPEPADHKRIPEYFPEIVVLDHLDKVLEPDPRAAENAGPEAVVLESDDHTRHGGIAEQQIIDCDRDEKDIEGDGKLEPHPPPGGRGVIQHGRWFPGGFPRIQSISTFLGRPPPTPDACIRYNNDTGGDKMLF
jgi:hypothetical protein